MSPDTNANELLCSTPVAMAVELNFLIKLYADVSVDHGTISANFKKKIDTKMFAGYRLSKLLQKATELLVSGNALPESPLSKLTEVKRVSGSKEREKPSNPLISS